MDTADNVEKCLKIVQKSQVFATIVTISCTKHVVYVWWLLNPCRQC